MKRPKQLSVVFLMLCALLCSFPLADGQRRTKSPRVGYTRNEAHVAGFFNVRAFGARGDGKALDTPAINNAIEIAAAAGGGTVLFPAGNYLSVSIHLKSNISLYLDQGATIVAAEPSKGFKYDPPEPNPWDAYQDFGHSHWHNSLIWGENLENVSILGPGRIWGKGLVRSGGQSRTKEQNDALNSARASEPVRPFGYPPIHAMRWNRVGATKQLASSSAATSSFATFRSCMADTSLFSQRAWIT